MAIAFPIVGRLSDLGGSRTFMITGLVLLGYSSYLMVGADKHTSFWVFAWWLIWSRLGLAREADEVGRRGHHVDQVELGGERLGLSRRRLQQRLIRDRELDRVMLGLRRPRGADE